jgi:3-oxoacyl-[acyl-carrier-protein] synthase II
VANRRVVVTGIGLVSSLGIGTDVNWRGLTTGKSGVGQITHFNPTDYASRIAGEVKNFDPLRFVPKKDVKKMDIFIQYAIAASQFAMDDAKLQITDENAPNVGVFLGSGIGGFMTIENEHKHLLSRRPATHFSLLHPFGHHQSRRRAGARFASARRGPNLATCTACSASAHAIGDSYEIIKRGDCRCE